MHDHEMASVVDLTTVAQPVREQGALAARLLLDLLDARSRVTSTSSCRPGSSSGAAPGRRTSVPLTGC
jgi:DNA-binding LacI/PurR family transcriptional regulator